MQGFLSPSVRRALPKSRKVGSETGQKLVPYDRAGVCRHALAGAQRDRHLLVYVDEAHIHQDCDLGYGWGERGQRLWIASRSPGLSARVSFYGLYLSSYGLYLYNEGQ